MSKINLFSDYALFLLSFVFFALTFVEIITGSLFFFLLLLTMVFSFGMKNALRSNGTSGVYFIFLSCFFVFILGGRYFNYANINYASTMAGAYYISDSTLIISLSFYSLVLSTVNLSYTISHSKFSAKHCNSPKFDSLLFEIGRLLFFIFLPGTILKFYLEFKFILDVGYYAYYSEGVNAPFWIDASRYFFVISFAILISSFPSWKTIKYYFFSFALFALCFLLLGVRSNFVLYMSFLYYIYYNLYSTRKLKVLTMFAIFVVLVSILLFVQFYRQGWQFDLKNGNLVSYFFTSQSNSFYILPFTINYFDSFTSQFSVFSPLSPKTLIFRSQNIERLSELNLLGDVISYKVLGAELFSEGKGLGGNFVAELYQSGIFITILLSTAFGTFLAYFQNNIMSSRYIMIISVVVVGNVAYISRSSLFRNFNLFVILSVLFVILTFIRLAVIKFKRYREIA